MKCWVCKRQARRFGHNDGRHKTGDPRRYPIDWVFCSRRCQDAFHALYGNWLRVKEGHVNIKGVVILWHHDLNGKELLSEKSTTNACHPKHPPEAKRYRSHRYTPN